MRPGGDRPLIDHYKILQVDPEADTEVIQAAYRRLARKYHPDVMAGPEAAERMIAINRAWEHLGDPARRAAYDAERRRATSVADRGGAAAGGGGSEAARGTSSAQQPHEGPLGAAGPAGEGEPSAAGGARTPPDAGPEARESGARPASATDPSFEAVSRDWTSGRSTSGYTYDPTRMSRPQGDGSAGVPPGTPSGSVLNFGRYAGWSMGQIARADLEYLEWLDRAPIGRAYRDEIDVILRRTGRRRSADVEASRRRGLFRRP